MRASSFPMDPQFQELAQITRDVTETVTAAVTQSVAAAVNKHVTEVVTAAEQRLAEQAKVNVEGVKAEARLAAEGFGGVLQSIDDRLGRLESDLTQQFDHCNAVLKNHNDRITTLEEKAT